MVKEPSGKAVLLLHRKLVLEDGHLVETKVWQLPAPTSERPHGLKYSLFFGKSGKRLIGYDNERGKGDHRHYGEREENYSFVSLQQLIEDFSNDIRRYLENRS